MVCMFYYGRLCFAVSGSISLHMDNGHYAMHVVEIMSMANGLPRDSNGESCTIEF